MMSFSTCTQVYRGVVCKIKYLENPGYSLFVCLSPDLRDRGITISSEMRQSLMLLHSYILVKVTTDLSYLSHFAWFILVHSKNTGCEPELRSYTASSALMSLHCLSVRPYIHKYHTSTVASSCRAYVDMNITKQHYSQPISCFWFILARWQVASQLQFHCLSRLNLFIPWCLRIHLPV